MNLSQCAIVATPINEANSPTGMKPPPTRCHSVARAARRKKYDPPRYTDPRTIEVKPGTIRHAKRRAVSSADGQKYNRTNATSRNGMITIDRIRVAGSTRSRAATGPPAADISEPPDSVAQRRTLSLRDAVTWAFAAPSRVRAFPGTPRQANGGAPPMASAQQPPEGRWWRRWNRFSAVAGTCRAPP